jgi:hypothetical protein
MGDRSCCSFNHPFTLHYSDIIRSYHLQAHKPIKPWTLAESLRAILNSGEHQLQLSKRKEEPFHKLAYLPYQHGTNHNTEALNQQQQKTTNIH